MTRREHIESLLRARPMTGAEIHACIGGTATAAHRYLCELRRRGHIVAAREWSDDVLRAEPGADNHSECAS